MVTTRQYVLHPDTIGMPALWLVNGSELSDSDWLFASWCKLVHVYYTQKHVSDPIAIQLPDTYADVVHDEIAARLQAIEQMTVGMTRDDGDYEYLSAERERLENDLWALDNPR